MNQSFTFGSLFSGIGGMDLGLETAGMTCRWQVEIDPFCQSILQKHWPNVTRYKDVKHVGANNLERVDLICGGFPCQPHSVAGSRAASQDERDLWPEFMRIIRELAPRWVVAENVRGLLSSENGRFFGNILRDLAQSGYDAEWEVLPASAFGAPHNRERTIFIAYPYSEFMEGRYVFGDCPPESRQEAYLGQSGGVDGTALWEKAISDLCREDDGLPAGLDQTSARKHRRFRLKVLGNAVVPQIFTWIGSRILVNAYNHIPMIEEVV